MRRISGVPITRRNANHLCNLYPKYSEQAADGKHVIHFYNSFTCLMEQYWYDHLAKQLEQVTYPELVYNPMRNSEGNTILVCQYPDTMTIIMKGAMGMMKKEQFCQVKGQFVTMPPIPVKTLMMKKIEELKEIRERSKLITFHPDLSFFGIETCEKKVPESPESSPASSRSSSRSTYSDFEDELRVFAKVLVKNRSTDEQDKLIEEFDTILAKMGSR